MVSLVCVSPTHGSKPIRAIKNRILITVACFGRSPVTPSGQRLLTKREEMGDGLLQRKYGRFALGACRAYSFGAPANVRFQIRPNYIIPRAEVDRRRRWVCGRSHPGLTLVRFSRRSYWRARRSCGGSFYCLHAGVPDLALLPAQIRT